MGRERLRTISVVALLVIAAVGMATVAAVPVAADQHETTASTPTPTPVEGGEDTSTGGDGGSQDASSNDRNADLTISQPSYVDSSPGESSQNGTAVYEVSGDQLVITANNFDAESVTNYGVEETGATLQQREGTWVLEPGASGTYRVWWRADGDVYSAYIKVEIAEYVHISGEEYSEMQDKAGAWEWFAGQLRHAGITHGDEDIETIKDIASDAVAWYEFYLNPWSALTGGFVAIVTILISEPGGWLFLSLLLLVFGLTVYTLVKQNRRFKRQFSDIEDLDEAERKAWEQEIKRAASKDTLQDWGLTDSEAEAMKDHTGARNPRQFAEWVAGNIGEYRVVRMLLGAYEQLGYQLKVTRTRDDAIERVDLLRVEDESEVAVPDGGDSLVDVKSPGEASEEELLRLDWSELDGDVLWNKHVDTDDIEPIVQNATHADGFDLVEEAGIPIGEDGADHYILERREDFVDVLIEIVEHAASSTYTDDAGRPRPEVDFVEAIYAFVSHGSEKYRLPFWHLRDALLHARRQLDDDERLDQLATKSEDNEL